MSGFHPYAAVLRQQLEMRELEEVSEQDDLKCQMTHAGSSVCGVEVTHRLSFCEGAVNICAVAAASKEKEKQRRKHRCVRCKQPADVCWVIRPI